MAHLFYVTLGNKSRLVPGTTTPQANGGLTNIGDFQYLEAFYYWSGTEYALTSDGAWYFDAYNGFQHWSEKGLNYNALAVRAGDVAAVPEPQTYALMLAGLGALGIVTRRRKVPSTCVLPPMRI